MLLFPFLGWETSKAQEISADDLKFLKAEEKELVVLDRFYVSCLYARN